MSDEITLRLRRDDVTMCRAVLSDAVDDASGPRSPYRHPGTLPRLQTALAALDAALAADPALDDLETAIRECQQEFHWFELNYTCDGFSCGSKFVAYVAGDRFGETGNGDTPLEALRQAMARARGTEDQ